MHAIIRHNSFMRSLTYSTKTDPAVKLVFRYIIRLRTEVGFSVRMSLLNYLTQLRSERISIIYVVLLVEELNIPRIDIYNKVFLNHHDPLSLFPLRLGHGHYTAEGSNLIARSIYEKIYQPSDK